VPLVDLRAAFEPIRERVLAEIEAVLAGMQLRLGPQQRAFEREFAGYCGARDGVAVSSGSDALRAALLACGIGPGDEVVCPSLTFFATLEAVLHAGATPVLVDVDPETLTLDPEALAAALGPATRAVVPVHLYGHPADMDPILALAGERGLRVIEDAAQAHGARTRGRRCGSLGDAGCFSFYCTKNLGAFGEGGFVSSGDPEIAERVRQLRDHGRASKPDHEVPGFNWRMDEIQAAVLRIRLPGLDAANARRRRIAEAYAARLADLPLRTPRTRPGCEAVHNVYPIRVEARDELRAHLEREGVGTGVHYAVPAHRQAALRGRPHRLGALPVTERACRELLSLPIYPELRDEQVEWVADRVRDFFGAGSGRA